MFHYDRFRHSTNIKLITATVRESVMLVLVMEEICEEAFEMPSRGMIFIPGFMMIG
jgi:hypothetical protein